MSICTGCACPIYDRYLLNVMDKPWHADCLACTDCRLPLSERCFARCGRLYCRTDFLKNCRRFGTQCAGCDRVIDTNDLMRRVGDRVFHVDCFRCSICQRRVNTGEQLYIVDGNKFVCEHDYTHRRSGDNHSDTTGDTISDETASYLSADCSKMIAEDCDEAMTSADTDGRLSLTEVSPDDSHNDERGRLQEANTGECQAAGDSSDGSAHVLKRRGPRTTIKAKQLDTLKTVYRATPKPSRHRREQLARETGLNMRVIQVWFQNRRSKDRRTLYYGNYRSEQLNRISLCCSDNDNLLSLFTGALS